MFSCIKWPPDHYAVKMWHSQNGARLEVFLIHPLGLADLQDLCVAQVLQATLELVQRIRLESERSHDLLPHHLHYLWSRAKRPGDIITSSEDRNMHVFMWTLPGYQHPLASFIYNAEQHQHELNHIFRGLTKIKVSLGLLWELFSYSVTSLVSSSTPKRLSSGNYSKQICPVFF